MNFKFIIAMAIFIIVSMFNLAQVDAQSSAPPTSGTSTPPTSTSGTTAQCPSYPPTS